MTIDELYQQPLGEFIAARNALAKTLAGAEAARVRALGKPTVVPWAVNLLYWRARATFDRLRKAGERLRVAQIAALKGRTADVRGASDADRRAIADAVSHAAALASRAGSTPDADELTRTLEALSVASDLPEPPGRMTRPLKPAGFEALSGIPVEPGKRQKGKEKRAKEEERRDQIEREAARRAKEEADDAEARRDRAAAAEVQARAAWERAKRDLQSAERVFESARSRT